MIYRITGKADTAAKPKNLAAKTIRIKQSLTALWSLAHIFNKFHYWMNHYLNMHMQYNTHDIHILQGSVWSYPIQAIRRSTYAGISHDKTPSQTSLRLWSLRIMSNKTQPERSNVVGLWPLYNLPKKWIITNKILYLNF